MPKRDGHEVLQWIRSQPGLKNLPVVMLTSSTQTEDVDRAYESDVTRTCTKFSCPAEFGQGVRIILKYWGSNSNVTPSLASKYFYSGLLFGWHNSCRAIRFGNFIAMIEFPEPYNCYNPPPASDGCWRFCLI